MMDRTRRCCLKFVLCYDIICCKIYQKWGWCWCKRRENHLHLKFSGEPKTENPKIKHHKNIIFPWSKIGRFCRTSLMVLGNFRILYLLYKVCIPFLLIRYNEDLYQSKRYGVFELIPLYNICVCVHILERERKIARERERDTHLKASLLGVALPHVGYVRHAKYRTFDKCLIMF